VSEVKKIHYLFLSVILLAGATNAAVSQEDGMPNAPIPILITEGIVPASGTKVTAQAVLSNSAEELKTATARLKKLGEGATSVSAVAVEGEPGSSAAKDFAEEAVGNQATVVVYDDENDPYVLRQKRNHRVISWMCVALRFTGIAGGMTVSYVYYHDFTPALLMVGMQAALQSTWLQFNGTWWFYPWLVSRHLWKLPGKGDKLAPWYITYLRLDFVELLYNWGVWGRAYMNGIGVDQPFLTWSLGGTVLSQAALGTGWDIKIGRSLVQNQARDPRNRYWYQSVSDFQQAATSVAITTAGLFMRNGNPYAYGALAIIYGAGFVPWEQVDRLLRPKAKALFSCASRLVSRRSKPND
jgi:hypothetical protein